MSCNISRPIWQKCLVVIMGSAIASQAYAQSSIQQADVLFQDGMVLENSFLYKEALAKYTESNRLAPANGTRIHIAFCEEKLGMYDKAWRNFLFLERAAFSVGRRDVGEDMKRRKEALDSKLCKLRIAVTESLVPGTFITLDKAPLESLDWSEDTRVLPGLHTLLLHEPGRLPSARSFHRGNAPNCEGPGTIYISRTQIQWEQPERRWWLSSKAGLGLGMLGAAGAFGFGAYSIISHQQVGDLHEAIVKDHGTNPSQCHTSHPKDETLTTQCKDLKAAGIRVPWLVGATVISSGLSAVGFWLFAKSMETTPTISSNNTGLRITGMPLISPSSLGLGLEGQF